MKSIFFIICSFLSLHLMAQKQLNFNDNGEFKILQLTDIHWSGDKNYTSNTEKTIRSLISKEKPDFIVLTGDNVNCTPMKSGWTDLAKILQESNKPWTAVFGNHDAEHDWTNAQTYDFFKTFPHFIGEKGNVTGVINYSLPIYSHSDRQIASILYFVDSGDYTHNPLLGSYAWIKSDQKQWYIDESNAYTKKLGRKIPSLMFFHIPLPEYEFIRKNEATIGEKREEVSSSDINSGMFASVLEQQDVMGIFCGHDHDNNYIGTHKGIALAYGNKTGNDGYGELEQGGRIIILKENKFAFKTYITTPTKTQFLYNYPAGLPEIDAKTNVLKALNIVPKHKGLKYQYFEGTIDKVNKIKTLKPIKEGISTKIDLSPKQSEDHFAIVYNAYINIPETAFYKFYTYSDDGSVLKIDDKIIVDNDGGHSATRKEGMVALEKGFHKIEILYFEDYMGQILDAGFSSINIPEKSLREELYH